MRVHGQQGPVAPPQQPGTVAQLRFLIKDTEHTTTAAAAAAAAVVSDTTILAR
jgi:hypothetical protein